ncbi:hypothetical protein MFIFM68171_09693 [Madurella fahalii]|uniref:Uncharacterized protein n=1 Tax=Madurella fahalii TaxID=1157608 RepID=A0ABQ0GP22_9PEZI
MTSDERETFLSAFSPGSYGSVTPVSGEGAHSLVDALLNFLDRTLDRLEAISKRVFERISIALRPSNERGLGKSHGEKDDGQRVGEKDMGSDMDSTYGEQDMY